MEYRIMNIGEMDAEGYGKAYELMSPARKKKADAFRFEDDKKRCIAADHLVRSIVAERLAKDPEDIVILNAENGRPYLQDGKLYISIAHSGDHVIAAVDTERIGVDIEKISKAEDVIIERLCDKEEIAYINGSPSEKERNRRFTEIWTFKEAFYKYDNSVEDPGTITFFNKDIKRVTVERDGYLATVVHE